MKTTFTDKEYFASSGNYTTFVLDLLLIIEYYSAYYKIFGT
mgnify:FL=1